MKLIRELEKEFNIKEKCTIRQGLFWCSYCGSSAKKPLRHGLKYKSCGCLRGKNILHGESETKLYSIWKAMKKRCHNKNNSDYKYYGAKGITVCQDWQGDFLMFKKWALANGYQKHLKIDRINDKKGYNPDNCQWIIHAENCRKRRDTKLNLKLVKEIRRKYKTGKYTQEQLAETYKISRSHISNIVRKNSILWKD